MKQKLYLPLVRTLVWKYIEKTSGFHVASRECSTELERKERQ